MVSVAIKHPSDDVALQFIKNSIAINCKLHNNQQKNANLIYHNHTLRAQLRLEVIHAGNFGGCGVEPHHHQPGGCPSALMFVILFHQSAVHLIGMFPVYLAPDRCQLQRKVPGNANRDNRSQNILRTAARNELRMEDKRGEEHIALSTEFAKSQLNQGHITDAQNQPRGQGFELRTDERGVIRVARGLFISADGQQKAAGEVLDMDTAQREIDLCLQQLRQLEMAAEQAQALKADVDSQIRMFNERLKPLNETLLFSAPDGMAFTSGEHMQLAASKNVSINAGGDISVGVMDNMTALAGDKIGMFARTGQLSLKASEGPIEVQAQNGNMRLFAEQKLTLTSESDISFTGKKRIVLMGGGSYLKLEQGKVEYGTTATYMRRVKRTMAAASQSMPMIFPRTGTAYIYSAIYQLQDKHGNILVNTPYRLITPSGQTATGFSDNEGRSVPVYTRQQEDVELHVLARTSQPEEPMWFVGETDTQQLETELRESQS